MVRRPYTDSVLKLQLLYKSVSIKLLLIMVIAEEIQKITYDTRHETTNKGNGWKGVCGGGVKGAF